MARGVWRNWAGTVAATPARVHHPRSVDDVVAAVHAARGSHLRPRGSGHSFTPLAATGGHALDLRGWTGIEALDTTTGRVRVRSGTTLRALNAALDAHGLALENLGDIDVQTISGAVATGTHGTGARLGGLATQVVALDLVLADGTAVACSAGEELFEAARVGLGALGVVTHVTLQCVPAFALRASERPEPLEDVLGNLDGLFDEADHVEFYWFPYGAQALVKRNHRVPVAEALAPLHPVRRFVEYDLVENAAFGTLCRIGRALPRTAVPLGRLASGVLSAREYGDRSHRVFATTRRVRFVESEWAVPRSRLAGVLDELRALVPRLEHPVLFPVEVRVAAADDVWLSTAHGRDTAYVAIHQYVGAPRAEYFAAFGAIAAAAGGRPHWGKEHHLDAAALAPRYPRFDDVRRVRRDVDPAGLFTNEHLDRVLGPG
ncbi:D-arabinono-1,4-lactone oxidase [Actinomycetospora lutea]|uniref:D-arabinono-1,4-lactone oxidase n=1 Tax=Actinomycetospora lutea TaxID=663604 RepID=UPI002365A9E9|nr:D-arabinono-1,4-lactone oxidase [Actinomycetospora lutea]MDD7942161.1 D-arabinono-1,4-lactone oxidase [Actinomycetospora lutea]